MRGYRLWLIVIIAITVVSVWMSLPDNPGIHTAGIDHDIKVVQGLDLQGGSRVLLQVAPGTQYDSSTIDHRTPVPVTRYETCAANTAPAWLTSQT